MFLYWTVAFFKYLGRDNNPVQLALGITVGMMLGLIPVSTLHWILLASLPFILRMNLLAVLVSTLSFGILALIFQSRFESFGFWILTEHSYLVPLFATAYHAPLLPYTSFNHSAVMGSSAIGLILLLPTFFISKILVKRYRERVHTFWLSTRIQRAYAHARRFVN